MTTYVINSQLIRVAGKTEEKIVLEVLREEAMTTSRIRLME